MNEGVKLGVKCEDRSLVSSNVDERRQILTHEVQPSHVERRRNRALRRQRHRHEDESGVARIGLKILLRI
jgi:hypothetical protein